MFVGAVATAIVIETHSTAGLADLATLVLSVSAVVLPLATRRRGRRKRQ
jgi:multisubunit Na+/H+ antiporter MnhB subunit